ncbi:MAG: hypothetical protein IJ680_06210 [Paludibacteraceae bacterium]|nr:hypothetical protein [Paludibacteraceae bacterium]
MKTRLASLLILFAAIGCSSLWANETITVTAQDNDISQNLDLKAVATVFGESKDLEEFERKLNDYDARITNLDLNGDGEVDYLRVVETAEGDKHLVVIQAILAQDIYQDVASIYVEKDPTTKQTVVQIVGDEYIYGTNYIIEPVYLHVPVIYDYFWRPYYTYWVSPWYWGYWPAWWHAYTCWGVHDYWGWMYDWHHAHHLCSYRYVSHPRNGFANMHHGISRRDFAQRNPERSFAARNAGHANLRNTRDIGAVRNTSNRRPDASGANNRTGSADRTFGSRNVRSTAVSANRASNGSRDAATRASVRSGEQFNSARNSRQTASSRTTQSGSRSTVSGSRTSSGSSTTSSRTSTSGSRSTTVHTGSSSVSRSSSTGSRSGSYSSGSSRSSYSSGSSSGSGYSTGSRSSSYSGGSSRSSYNNSSSSGFGGRSSSSSSSGSRGSYSSGSSSSRGGGGSSSSGGSRGGGGRR